MTPRLRDAATFWTASALFFLSGATGLAYQVIWFKRFSHVWGSSTLAMAAVAASFLTGLGLGAHLLGRFADRTRSCLLGYGACEAAIGVLAALLPFELGLLGHVSAALHPHLADHPLLHSLARFLLTFLAIGPPCVLMGGTLPLLIKHFTPPDGGPRDATGWLYAINTLGAALGCYLAGFHLLPSLGLFATNLGVAALNVAIGCIAALVALSWPAPGPAGAPLQAAAGGPAAGAGAAASRPAGRAAPAPPRPAPRSWLWRVYVAVLLTGQAALVLEVVWTRQLALILGGSTYAFTAMLFLILVGIGLGSLIFHAALRRRGDLSHVPAAMLAAIGAATCAGKLLVPQTTVVVGYLKDLRASQAWNAAISVGASAVLELLPAVGMGILFPVCVDLTRKRAADTGKTIGSVYAWNTAGSLAGATLATLVFVPAFGAGGTIALAVTLYAGAMLLLAPFPRTLPEAVKLGLLLLLMGCFATLSSRRVDPRITDVGMYMYGHVGDPTTRYELVSFEEGAAANVLVTKQGKDFSLRVNGKVDASTGQDMGMQLGLAYMPLCLRPQSRELCVIGFGSGTTSGAALLFPETRVTCLEIEPAVFRASRVFEGVNHSPERSSRFRVIFDDGRSHLQGTDANYDLILSEPSNPWIAGVSNLFTREFYEAAKARLAPGGILAQWIQVYSFSAADYALVARTVLGVFPHSGLIRISGGDTILLASDAPLVGGAEGEGDRGGSPNGDRGGSPIAAAQAIVAKVPDIERDLRRHFGTADVRSLLLAHLLLDAQALRAFVEAGSSRLVNTDLNMRLEFDAPLRLFVEGESSGEVMGRILAGARGEWFREAAAAWGASKEQAGAVHELLSRFDRKSQAGLIAELVALGLSLDPEHPALLAEAIAQQPPEDPAVLETAADRLLSLSRKEANRLGVTLFKGGSFEKAVRVLNRVLAHHPQSVTTWNNLAVAFEAWGKLEEAEKAFQQALSFDPVSEQTRRSYEAFQKKHADRGKAKGEAAPAQPADPATDPVAPPEAEGGGLEPVEE
ncbi:MAG: fused MFS/spermidine synthase [Planctomycetes bacterium]|nr:fused MFS/spermidine synthase [Planctomycetota bacterium]